MNIFTYSPKQVVLAVAGYTVTGWDNISILRSVEGFIPIRGIRGKNTRVQNSDTSVTLTIPLLQTSMANDVFSKIHQLDLQNGTGRLEFTLKDSSGTSVFSSTEAFILGYPEVQYSGSFEYRVWRVFALSTTTYNTGGNGKVDNIFNKVFNAASDVISSASNALDDLI